MLNFFLNLFVSLDLCLSGKWTRLLIWFFLWDSWFVWTFTDTFESEVSWSFNCIIVVGSWTLLRFLIQSVFLCFLVLSKRNPHSLLEQFIYAILSVLTSSAWFSSSETWNWWTLFFNLALVAKFYKDFVSALELSKCVAGWCGLHRFWVRVEALKSVRLRKISAWWSWKSQTCMVVSLKCVSLQILVKSI